MRVTNAPASRKRRIRTIKAAKGFRGRRSKLYRYAADLGPGEARPPECVVRDKVA